jgi:hypothetical protein
MDTILRPGPRKFVCAFLLIALVACGFGWRLARGERDAEFGHITTPKIPATKPKPAAPVVLQPPATPKSEPQGQHESFLRRLPNGEYLLPPGRFLTSEDQRELAVTPDIKIIHSGPPGTLEYKAANHYDPAAMAEYNRQKLRGLEMAK